MQCFLQYLYENEIEILMQLSGSFFFVTFRICNVLFHFCFSNDSSQIQCLSCSELLPVNQVLCTLTFLEKIAKHKQSEWLFIGVHQLAKKLK